MDHLTDGEIAAHLDGELSGKDARRVEAHLDRCGECVARRREIESISSRLEETLEQGLEPPRTLETASRGAPESFLTSGLKSAAAVAGLVTLGALAADAALPGHPIRDLVAEGVRRVTGGAEVGAPSVATDTGDTDRSERVSRRGVAVAPVDGEVVLTITGAAEGTTVRVERRDAARARISARGGRFRTDPGRLELVGPGPGDIRVVVPRRAESWRLDVNGRTVLRRSDRGIVGPGSGTVEERPAYEIVVGRWR